MTRVKQGAQHGGRVAPNGSRFVLATFQGAQFLPSSSRPCWRCAASDQVVIIDDAVH